MNRGFLHRHRWTWGLLWLLGLLLLIWGPALLAQTPSRLTAAQVDARLVKGYRAFFQLPTQDTLAKLLIRWTALRARNGDSLTLTRARAFVSALERAAWPTLTRDEELALGLVFDSLLVQQFNVPLLRDRVNSVWYSVRADSVRRRLWRADP